jgi:hypothetical protein
MLVALQIRTGLLIADLLFRRRSPATARTAAVAP